MSSVLYFALSCSWVADINAPRVLREIKCPVDSRTGFTSFHNQFHFRLPEAPNPERTWYALLHDQKEVKKRLARYHGCRARGRPHLEVLGERSFVPAEINVPKLALTPPNGRTKTLYNNNKYISHHNLFDFFFSEARNPEQTWYDLLYDDDEVDRRLDNYHGSYEGDYPHLEVLDEPSFVTVDTTVPKLVLTAPSGETTDLANNVKRISQHNQFHFGSPEARNPEGTWFDLLYDNQEVHRRVDNYYGHCKGQICNWVLLDKPNVFGKPTGGAPLLMLTTPEGETKYPTDMKYYPLSGGGRSWADLDDDDDDE